MAINSENGCEISVLAEKKIFVNDQSDFDFTCKEKS